MHDDRIYQDLVNSYYNLYTLNEDVDPIEEAKEDEGLTPGQKQIARQKRQGTDELSRQTRHLFGRYQKQKPVNEETVIEYLLDEGFATTVDGAIAIYERMSDKWYAVIMEGLPRSATMNKSEMAKKLEELRKELKKLMSQLDLKNPDPNLVKQIQGIQKKIKDLSQGRRELENISGPSEPERITKNRQAAKEDPMTPQERAALGATRTKKPEGTSDERAETIGNIAKRKPSKAGSTPQSTDMNLPNLRGSETREQQRRNTLSNALVGNMDPTYLKGGKKTPLISQGQSVVYHTSQKNPRVAVKNKYQQDATGSGTSGPTPAGSTVDPDRQKGPRGTGRRPNQRG
jgi:ribosomal protein L29